MKTRLLKGVELLLVLSGVLIFGGCTPIRYTKAQAETCYALLDLAKTSSDSALVGSVQVVHPYATLNSCSNILRRLAQEELDFLPGGNLEKSQP